MFCKKCGAKIKDGTKFCPKCGSPVSPAAYKKSPPKWAIGAAVVVVAGILAVGIGSIGGKDKTEV